MIIIYKVHLSILMLIFLKILFFVFVVLGVIILGHHGFDYLKDNYTRCVKKNMYVSHIEKYEELLKQLQYSKIKEQDKIEMENELFHFMQESIQENT